MGDQITVTISNWDKYNVRKKDYKKAWWFSLSNSILEDVDVYDLTDAEFRAWVYILSQASKKASSTIVISLDHFSRVCRGSPKALKSLVTKFSKKSILSSESGRESTESDRHRTNKQTIQTIQTPASLDFDSFWEKYPKKVDRGYSEKCFARALKRNSLEEILKALDRYQLEKNKNPNIAWKNPSTFLNNIPDFLRDDYGHIANSLDDIGDLGFEKEATA